MFNVTLVCSDPCLPSSSLPTIRYLSKPTKFLSVPRPNWSRVHWSCPALLITLHARVTVSPMVAVWLSGVRRNCCWRTAAGTSRGAHNSISHHKSHEGKRAFIRRWWATDWDPLRRAIWHHSEFRVLQFIQPKIIFTLETSYSSMLCIVTRVLALQMSKLSFFFSPYECTYCRSMQPSSIPICSV